MKRRKPSDGDSKPRKRRNKNDTFRAVPLPAELSESDHNTDNEEGTEGLFEDEDLKDLLNADGRDLQFLEELPKHQLDREASQPRKKDPAARGVVPRKADADVSTSSRETSITSSSSVDTVDTGDLGDGVAVVAKKNEPIVRRERDAVGRGLPPENGLDRERGAEPSTVASHRDPYRKLDTRKAGTSSDEEGEDWERGPRIPVSMGGEGGRSKKHYSLPIKTHDGLVMSLGAGMHESLKDAENIALPVARRVVGDVVGVTVHDELETYLSKKEAEKTEAIEKAKKIPPWERQEKDQGQRIDSQKEVPDEMKESLPQKTPLAELESFVSTEARRQEAKRMIAEASQALLADPEKNIAKRLRVLLGMLRDPDDIVARWTMLSLLAIFRDIVPGYRIVPVEEKMKDGVVEVSKEVKKLWEYESVLLRGYQVYLKTLLEVARASSRSGRAPASVGRTSYRCLAMLLQSNPHFNFASDLLQTVVPGMVHGDQAVRRHCRDAIKSMLGHALGTKEAGQTAVEAVQLVADLVRKRKCVAPSEVVECVLSVEFPEIASGEDFEAAQRARKSKKKGKRKRKSDDVDRAFEEAAAVTDVATRRHQQSMVLEALFEIFFRVIKTATSSGLIRGVRDGPSLPASRFQKKFPLLAPTMVGLGKFAHLISIDYFQDLMAALQDLVGSAALPPVPKLRCLLTAAIILKGQAESLNVDRRNLYCQLYESISKVAVEPLEELDDLDDGDEEACDAHGAGSVVSEDRQQQQQQRGNASQRADTPSIDANADRSLYQDSLSVLLSQVVDSLILDSRELDVPRQAAFAKQLASLVTAATDSGTSMSSLAAIYRLLRRSQRLRSMLENEEGGPSGMKAYKPSSLDPAEAGALSVPLWELSLACLHFHPHVAQVAQRIVKMNNFAVSVDSTGSKNDSMSTILPPTASLAEIAALYSVRFGGFRPSPPRPITSPPNVKSKKQSRERGMSKAASLLAPESEDQFVSSIISREESDSKILPGGSEGYQAVLSGWHEDISEDECRKKFKHHIISCRLLTENSHLEKEKAAIEARIDVLRKFLRGT